jgi:uncharacterized protein YdeI (BOF family)
MVEEIRPDEDRVRVVGTIKTVLGPNDFTLEDATGTVNVTVSEEMDPLQVSLIRERMVVRVHGTVEVAMDGGQKISADLVQEFSRVDMELYQKVRMVANF